MARDDLAAHGGGTGLDRALGGPLDHCAPAVPETVRLSGLVHVLFEDQRGEAAVVVGILSVVAGEVGEVLHVDLDGGRADVVAVVLVEPGAVGLVAVVADDDVGKRPGSTTRFAHVTRPATLGAVGPFLRDVRNAETVFSGVDLDIGGLLARRSGLIDGDVLESPRRDISITLSSSDEIPILVVNVDLLDGSLSIGQAVAVKSDADSKRGAICWIGVGGKEPLKELKNANNATDNANNVCHCERSFVYGT